MYYLRIAGINFPVAPESITTEHENKNQTVVLANEKEINIIKKPGLQNFSFDVRLPEDEYSWAYWEQPEGAKLESGFNEPNAFLKILEDLKKKKSSFVLMVVREDGENFKKKVTLETLSITEAKEGITASCSFKEYKDFKTKIKKKKSTTTSKTTKTRSEEAHV